MYDEPVPTRPPIWKWMVCGLLLLGTMINYMDRLTVNVLSKTILEKLNLDEGDYGYIESAFAIAFATGALIMGWLADRINVRWLFPLVVLAWSLAGFLTGFAFGFWSLLFCRAFLGAAESGHWPCSLRTTQRILPREQRTLGNSLLQSGAALGAIFTPPLVIGLRQLTGDWRASFFVIGTMGVLWVGLWLTIVRTKDLELPPPPADDEPPVPIRPSGWQVRRFVALIFTVVAINVAWHYFRAWLPLFLQKRHDYTEEQTAFFLTGYYISTDLGSLAAGFMTLWLTRSGRPVHLSRMAVFLVCCALTALSVVAARAPTGPGLLVLLMVIGFGALGLFPVYYSLTQELTTRHQGKVTGALSFSCWVAMAALHSLV